MVIRFSLVCIFLLTISLPTAAEESALTSQYKWFKLTLNKAKKGNLDAGWQLFEYYNNGQFVIRNEEKANYWLNWSAEHGLAKANYELGRRMFESEPSTENQERTLHYLTLAAKADNLNAQYLLGLFYENAGNIAWDISKSRYWYKKASLRRYRPAIIRYAKLLVIDKNTPDWQKRIADQIIEKSVKGESITNISFDLFNPPFNVSKRQQQ